MHFCGVIVACEDVEVNTVNDSGVFTFQGLNPYRTDKEGAMPRLEISRTDKTTSLLGDQLLLSSMLVVTLKTSGYFKCVVKKRSKQYQDVRGQGKKERVDYGVRILSSKTPQSLHDLKLEARYTYACLDVRQEELAMPWQENSTPKVTTSPFCRSQYTDHPSPTQDSMS